MTATRWWVRLAARWLARIDGVSGQVQMASLAVTAFSTFSLVLQNSGLGHVVPYLGVVVVAAGLAYIYLYNEGGVRNQVARDVQDLGYNFHDPRMAIDDMTIAAGIFAAREGRPPDPDEFAAIEQGVRVSWEEYRDGIDWMEDD